MSKRQVIMILGVLVSIIQFLGFTDAWSKYLTLILGIVIVGVAYKMAKNVNVVDTKALPYIEHKSPPISENK
ncbi:MAG: hypothetical protein WCK03_02775 [Candidatus Taylorbacteria bacterium]